MTWRERLRLALPPVDLAPVAAPPAFAGPYTGRTPDDSMASEVARAKAWVAEHAPAAGLGGDLIMELVLPLGFSPCTPLRVDVTGASGPAHALFAKVARDDEEARLALAKEILWTRWGEASRVTPRVVWADAERGILISEHAKGRSVAKATLASSPLLPQVLAAAHRLHRTPPPAGLDVPPGDGDFHRPLAAAWGAVDAAPGSLSRHAHEALRAMGEEVEATLRRDPAPPRGIHGDLMPGNILVDGAHDHISLVDYGHACVGDPIEDIAYFMMSTLMPIDRCAEVLEHYHATDTDARTRDLRRLQLHLLRARLERYVRAHVWWPGDRPLLTHLGQALWRDAAVVLR